MGVATVVRDDFRNTRRSYVVLGVVGVFAALTGLIFVASSKVHPDPYRTLWGVSALVAFAFPLFVAPLTYLAIAGDRSRGSIKYFLGLPNTRGEYFLAKYISRGGVAVAAVVLATAVGFVAAAATYQNFPGPSRFAKFAAVSALYAVAVTGLYLSVSAVTTSRSRAMFGVIGVYFLLGPFWYGMLPVVNLQTIIDTVTSFAGVDLSATTRQFINVASPLVAYFQATEIVYTGVLDQYETFQQFDSGPDSLATTAWFTSLVLVTWATAVPALAYLKFRVSELG